MKKEHWQRVLYGVFAFLAMLLLWMGANAFLKTDKYPVEVLFLGDSIVGGNRGGTSIPYYVATDLNIRAGNAAFGGSALSQMKDMETVVASTPVKEGYVFAGWYSDAEFSNYVTASSLSNEVVKNGEIYAISPKCPHLGCELEWNEEEQSFDCPCHGSRFQHTGELEDNPAQKDLQKK